MRTSGSQSFELLPSTGHRVGGELAAHAADRRAIPQDPVLRKPADGGCPEVSGRARQSQASPDAHEADGYRGVASQAPDHHSWGGRADLPLPAPRPEIDRGRSGMEFRHHLYSDAAWVHVPDSGDRLVQPIRALVAAVEQAGWWVLFGGVE